MIFTKSEGACFGWHHTKRWQWSGITSIFLISKSWFFSISRNNFFKHVSTCPQLPVYGIGQLSAQQCCLALVADKYGWVHSNRWLLHPKNEFIAWYLWHHPRVFLKLPKALAQVQTPIQAWVGTNDLMTTPAQAESLKQRLGDLVDLRTVEGAGYFSFIYSQPYFFMKPQRH